MVGNGHCCGGKEGRRMSQHIGGPKVVPQHGARDRVI